MSDQNKVIVVTGGSKGIGRSIVEKFASDKFEIITCSRNEDELAKLQKDIEKDYQIKIHTLAADLSKRSEVERFVEFIRSIGKPVEILVNNAGRFIPGEIQTETDGVLEELMDTNLYSAYHLTRGLIPGMKTQKRGYIFNICSIASLAAYANGGSYTITKFAMYGMSKVLREELKAFNIKVTSVLPGATLTSSWEGANFPEERFMKPGDVADLVFSTYNLSDNTVVEDILMRPQFGDL